MLAGDSKKPAMLSLTFVLFLLPSFYNKFEKIENHEKGFNCVSDAYLYSIGNSPGKLSRTRIQ